MNNIGDLLHWLKANPDMLVLIGVAILVVCAVIEAKKKGKNVWYVVGSVFTLASAGLLIGVLAAAAN
jgi:hypothetical protein